MIWVVGWIAVGVATMFAFVWSFKRDLMSRFDLLFAVFYGVVLGPLVLIVILIYLVVKETGDGWWDEPLVKRKRR